MSWLGLDIGGANLKAANGRGWARSVPFALWREANGLADAILDLVKDAPRNDRWAVTMTGELCDVFRTKAEGVHEILSAVKGAAGGREVTVYLVGGEIVPVALACERTPLAAASNWHALATFAGRFIESGSALLIDVGSTTTDIIPIVDGRSATRGLNDTDRLLAGELVYTGVLRTPVCAIASSLPYRERRCPVAAELFATAADVYVLLGDVAEDVDAAWTADGRPLTTEFACERLARMICADATTFGMKDALHAAEYVRGRQMNSLQRATEQVIRAMAAPPKQIVISGTGEFLARQLASTISADVRMVSLTEALGPEASACAPAHALAILAQERVTR